MINIMFEPLVFGSIQQSLDSQLKHTKGSKFNQKDQNPLYEAIRRNLSSEPCLMHDDIIEYMLEGKLYCKACFQERLSYRCRQLSSEQYQKMSEFCHLKTIMRYPIIAIAETKTILQYPQKLLHLMLNSYHPLFPKKNFIIAQKQLLQSFIQRIKNRIDELCDQLVSTFQREVENFEQINRYKEESKNINKVYEQQFLQLLGEKYKQGNKAQLEEIFQNFKFSSQDPFTKITSNLDEIMGHLSLIPNINSKILADIYTTVTDERIWRINEIITKRGYVHQNYSNQVSPMLEGQQISLQNQYELRISEGKTFLNKTGELIGFMNTSFDSFYHLKKYKLACVNYQGIQILNYFDKLELQGIYNIQGCTDLLVFDDILVILSNKKVYKLHLTTGCIIPVLDDIKQIKRHKSKQFTVACLSNTQRQSQLNIYEQYHCVKMP